METAARRPRPNRERLLPWLDRKLSPTCPALFAARMTSPTKVFGRLAPRLPWLIRRGRTRTHHRRALSWRKTALCGAMALAALISFGKMWRAPAVNVAGVTKSSRATNHMGRTDGRPFPLPSTVGLPLLSRCHSRTCDNFRKRATECDFDHRDLISPIRCTNRLREWGTSPDRSTVPWARDVRF